MHPDAVAGVISVKFENIPGIDYAGSVAAKELIIGLQLDFYAFEGTSDEFLFVAIFMQADNLDIVIHWSDQ